jgi:hypothetical protein
MSNKLCVWDAFGDYSCKNTSSASGFGGASTFARPNPSRPDWELFEQPAPTAASAIAVAAAKRMSNNTPADAKPKHPPGTPVTESFCGCQAGMA